MKVGMKVIFALTNMTLAKSHISKTKSYVSILSTIGPLVCAFESYDAVSGVGSSPALATCETSQVLLAGVSGGFSRGSPVFAPTY